MAQQKKSRPRTAVEDAAARKRTADRKEANRLTNEVRRLANIDRRARGELTPWEQQKAKRKERRDALRAEGKLPPIGMTRAAWEIQKIKQAGRRSK